MENKKTTTTVKLSPFDTVSEMSIAMAIRHMSVMLRSGISLSKTITIMAAQSESEILRKIFLDLSANIQRGVTLADSMRKYPTVFSSIIVSIIEVGEQGGGLDQNLLFLADYLKKKADLQKKINGALLYPLIVFALTFVEMAGVIFFVLPKLDTLFMTFKNIPSYVMVIMGVTAFIRMYWYWLLLGAFVIGIIVMLFLKTPAGHRFYSRLSLVFPILNNVVKLNILTSIARTVGVLMSNGIPLVRALRISAETTTNTVYKEILFKVAKDTEDGKGLTAALEAHKKYFPETFIRLIELGESSGSLEENLRYLHGLYSDELQDLTSNMATLIEPLLLIFIGMMIGLLALMIVGPIYSLTSSIN